MIPERFINNIGALQNLTENWDSYHSPPISEQALTKLRQLLRCLSEFEASPVRVVPVSGGGIQLQWETPEWSEPVYSIELEIWPNGNIETLIEAGEYDLSVIRTDGTVEHVNTEGLCKPWLSPDPGHHYEPETPQKHTEGERHCWCGMAWSTNHQRFLHRDGGTLIYPGYNENSVDFPTPGHIIPETTIHDEPHILDKDCPCAPLYENELWVHRRVPKRSCE